MEVPACVLFTRVPQPRRCKTRLLPALSGEGAAELQRALALDLAWRLADLGLPLTVRYALDEAAPDAAGALARFAAELPAGVRLAPQQGEGLGARMRAAMDDELARGAASVLLMGSDLPLVTPEVLREALGAFGICAQAGADVLVCPSDDGGYWLVGLREPFPAFFDCRGYGGSDVLHDELAICAAHGRTVALGPRTWDVDRPDDLVRLAALVAQGDPRIGERTRAFLRRLGG